VVHLIGEQGVKHDLSALLGAAVGLRVFAGDVRRLTRRLLGAGVRVGAEQLAAEQAEAQRPGAGVVQQRVER
jgi:hypothetical protein